MDRPGIPVVVVAGPTASGKSALALQLAQAFQGEIVNGDSLQLYRGMDIGTAKPAPAEMAAVPHHLFSLLEPPEVFSAGDFAARARECVREIHRRGRLPIVAGGTGFYIRAMLEGLAPAPRRDDELRASLLTREERRPGFLARALRVFDAGAAARIHGNDRNKLLRALEICLLSRGTTGMMFQQGRDTFVEARALKLVLHPPRACLATRIAERTQAMFERGLLAEVERLLKEGVPRDAKAFESIGYRQACLVIEGHMTLDGAIESVVVATRQYAKRQITWFRREADVKWLEGFGDDALVQDAAALYLREFLREFTN